MANISYNNGKKNLLNGSFDLVNDTVKVMLVTSTYTPDIDADEFIDDVTNEVSGTGYTAGGATLGTKAVTNDTTNDRGKFDAADTEWTTSTITARAAVVYKDTGTPGTSPVLCYVDFGADKSTTAGTFTIQWNADGIYYIG